MDTTDGMHMNAADEMHADPAAGADTASAACTLTFLGTAAGCGVPSFFCTCAACESARRDSSRARGCSGVVVTSGGENTLIDMPPDLRHQLSRESIAHIERVLLTHAHFDHMGGAGELEYYVRVERDEPLPLLASEFALSECSREFGYMRECFDADAIEPYGTRVFGGLTVQALPLVHVSGTYGYLITAPSSSRTFYAPDTGALRPEVAEILRGVDNLVMDSSYWGENPRPTRHMSAQETVRVAIDELGAGRVYLTHLAPHMGGREDWVALVEEYAAGYDGRVVVAADGMRIEL